MVPIHPRRPPRRAPAQPSLRDRGPAWRRACGRRKMLVADRHPWIAVAEDLHDGPLRDAGHRQLARHVVPQVVKREPSEPQALHQPRERAGEHVGGPRSAGAPLQATSRGRGRPWRASLSVSVMGTVRSRRLFFVSRKVRLRWRMSTSGLRDPMFRGVINSRASWCSGPIW